MQASVQMDLSWTSHGIHVKNKIAATRDHTFIYTAEGERDRKQKISDLRTNPGPLWRLHTWFDPFCHRLIGQREVESMTIGGAEPRS